MQLVNAWKASDGEMFPSEELCRRHELKLKLLSAIDDATVAEKVCQYAQSIFDIMQAVGYRRNPGG